MPGIEAIHNPRTDKLFARLEEECMDITFDDISLVPEQTEVRPADAALTTNLTPDIQLQQPFLSAAMDTITERDMATALAKLGGAGVLHASMSPKRLKEEAQAVKFHRNRMLEKPFCARSEETVAELVAKNYSFQTLPVVNNDGVLVGMFTGQSAKFWDSSPEQTVSELMVTGDRLVSAPKGTDIESAYHIMSEAQISALPLVGKGGKVKGMYVWSDVKRAHYDNPEGFSLGSDGRLLVVAAVETRPELVGQRIDAAGKYIDVYAVDSSHGNSKDAVETVEFILDTVGAEAQVIGGNVVDGKSAVRLAKAGAVAIKVGIGGGSICTTRQKTGNGRLQLSAVYWVRRALNEQGFSHIPVISDGGITNEGDAAKAIAVGAQSVMLGSRVAATTETPGDVVIEDGKEYKIYRGQGSIAAQLDARESRGYTTGNVNSILSEGVVALRALRGSVAPIIEQHAGGLRNAISNANARNIPKFQRRVLIRRNGPSGAKEGSAHIQQVGTVISN